MAIPVPSLTLHLGGGVVLLMTDLLTSELQIESLVSIIGYSLREPRVA